MYSRTAMDKSIGALYTVVIGGILYVIGKSYSYHRKKRQFLGDEYYRLRYGEEDVVNHNASCDCGKIRFCVTAPRIIHALDSNDSMSQKKGRYPQFIASKACTEVISDINEVSIYTSKDGLRHFFCSKCGIHVFHKNSNIPDVFHINVGCLEMSKIVKLNVVFVPSKDILYPSIKSLHFMTKEVGMIKKNSHGNKDQSYYQQENQTADDMRLLSSLASWLRLQSSSSPTDHIMMDMPLSNINTLNSYKHPVYSDRTMVPSHLNYSPSSTTTQDSSPEHLPMSDKKYHSSSMDFDITSSSSSSANMQFMSNQDDNDDQEERLSSLRRHLLRHCQ